MLKRIKMFTAEAEFAICKYCAKQTVGCILSNQFLFAVKQNLISNLKFYCTVCFAKYIELQISMAV